MKVYMGYNGIVPHFYGEGISVEEAIDNMVSQTRSFAIKYADNIERLYWRIYMSLA